ncbi:Lipase Maturation Factor 2 [Manis pentadactyla]|nr:Lipase Maturation Factor 2 [Manis pentadactyla]
MPVLELLRGEHKKWRIWLFPSVLLNVGGYIQVDSSIMPWSEISVPIRVRKPIIDTLKLMKPFSTVGSLWSLCVKSIETNMLQAGFSSCRDRGCPVASESGKRPRMDALELI